MALTLTSSHIAQLERAMAVLLSPLRYGDLDSCHSAVRASIEPLVGADRSGLMLPIEGEPLSQMDPADDPAKHADAAYYQTCDERHRAAGRGASVPQPA